MCFPLLSRLQASSVSLHLHPLQGSSYFLSPPHFPTSTRYTRLDSIVCSCSGFFFFFSSLQSLGNLISEADYLSMAPDSLVHSNPASRISRPTPTCLSPNTRVSGMCPSRCKQFAQKPCFWFLNENLLFALGPRKIWKRHGWGWGGKPDLQVLLSVQLPKQRGFGRQLLQGLAAWPRAVSMEK